MGQIDQFIWGQMTPQLGPGEQILWTGFVRHPKSINAFGVVGEYGESWNAAATNMRLVLMLTDTSGLLTLTPKPMCRQAVTWWYQELDRVGTGRCTNSDGVYFGLFAREPFGPYKEGGKRYDTFPHTEGVDGQPAFFAQFPQWLQQQVTAGAFPMDAQRHAQAQQHQQAKQAAEAAERQRAMEASQRRQQALDHAGAAVGNAATASLPWILPVAMGLVMLAVIGGGAATLIDALETQRVVARRLDEASRAVELHEANVKWTRSGKEPFTGCPEDDLDLERWANHCHGCYVSGTPQTGAHKVHTRGAKHWSCPSVEELEKRLADDVRKREAAEDERGDAGKQLILGGAVSLVGLVAGVAFFVWFFVRRARRPR